MSSDEEPEKRNSQDIRPGELGSLDWRPEHARQSLDLIYQHVVDAALRAISWYRMARRPKRRWAQRLRVAAIVMVAVAGVLPILSQILGEGSSVVIQPAWATVALAIAVALVALDRLSQDSIEHLLDLAKALTKKTDDLIQSETLQWVKEFRETLTEIERSATSESKR